MTYVYERLEEPIYRLAPTTDRDAGLLAKRHRFDSLASLIEFLPRSANVLDVGAGLSNLGVTVARSRSDIHWTNFDYSYNDLSILGRAQADAPENMSFVAGDATNLTQTYQDEEFDAVFSYWMFPHLSIDSRLPAEDVARQIYRVARQGALISIGPKTDKHLFPLWHEKKSIRVQKNPMVDEGEFAEEAVRATKLGPLMRYVSIIDNVVGTQTVGTTAGIQGGGFIPHIYDQRIDAYVSPFSHSGARIIGRVAIATCRYIAKNPPHRH
jgi:SAM-dependent methyltransferase